MESCLSSAKVSSRTPAAPVRLHQVGQFRLGRVSCFRLIKRNARSTLPMSNRRTTRCRRRRTCSRETKQQTMLRSNQSMMLMHTSQPSKSQCRKLDSVSRPRMSGSESISTRVQKQSAQGEPTCTSGVPTIFTKTRLNRTFRLSRTSCRRRTITL